MESLFQLCPYFKGNFNQVILNSKTKPIKRCMADYYTTIEPIQMTKCYYCNSTQFDQMEFIQIPSMTRKVDELIESHYACRKCLKI